MNKVDLKIQWSSSFYGPLLWLPKTTREAMLLLYGFCRAVDDIADSALPANEKMAALDQWQSLINASSYELWMPREIYDAIKAMIARYALDQNHFNEIIEGMRMDVRGEMVYPSQENLMQYCDRVAGCVGQLSIRLFGFQHPDTVDYATYLGRALQLTNILRDVQEDARMGRMYLPREAFEHEGQTQPDFGVILSSAHHLRPVCETISLQAQEWFLKAKNTLNAVDRATMQPAEWMGFLYQRLLKRMIRDNWSYRTPYRVTTGDKAILALKGVTNLCFSSKQIDAPVQ